MKQFSRTLTIALFVLCAYSHGAFAATRTWSGGSHNWGTTAAWVEGIVPTSSDTCVFNVNTTGTITVEASDTTTDICGTVDFTGFTGTLSMAAGTELNIATAFTGVAGMTLSMNSTAIINFKHTTATATFTPGGLSYGILNSTAQTTGSLTLSGTFATLTISQGASTQGQFKLSGATTVSGTCTGNGNSVLNRDYITSDTKGTARTLSCGTATFTNADFQDITAAGAASWNLAAITGGSGNCGSNTGITFTTPINAYMKTAVSVNWSGSNWYTASGGSTPITNTIPLCQDTAIFDANSVTAGSKTITITNQSLRLPGMNWTGVLNTPTLSFSNATSLFGNVVFVSGMAFAGSNTNVITLEGRGANTITTAGQAWPNDILINDPGGTWSQNDNFSSSATTNAAFVVTSGQWLTGAHTFTLTGSSSFLKINGGTFTAGGTVSLTGTGGSSVSVLSGTLDATGQTVSMTVASSILTLSGGTFNVGILTRTGFACTLAGTAMTVGTSTDCTTWAINSGTLVSPAGTAMSFNAGAITVINNGSCTFGQVDTWPEWMIAANQNIRGSAARAGARNG